MTKCVNEAAAFAANLVANCKVRLQNAAASGLLGHQRIARQSIKILYADDAKPVAQILLGDVVHEER